MLDSLIDELTGSASESRRKEETFCTSPGASASVMAVDRSWSFYKLHCSKTLLLCTSHNHPRSTLLDKVCTGPEVPENK